MILSRDDLLMWIFYIIFILLLLIIYPGALYSFLKLFDPTNTVLLIFNDIFKEKIENARKQLKKSQNIF